MLLLIGLVASVLALDPYDCTKIAKKGDEADKVAVARKECIKTGWCYWQAQGEVCKPDKCLLYISDDTYNTAPDTTKLCPGENENNGVGSACKLYYLTGVPDCTQEKCPETGATDLYCRESATSLEHNVIDKCFYDDMKKRTTDANFIGPFVNGTNCAANTSVTGSNYTYAVESEDCSLLTDDDAICKCLKPKWCALYPACTLSKDGDSCIQDPCNAFSVGKLLDQNGAPTNCVSGAPTTCVAVPAQLANNGGKPLVGARCVSNNNPTAVKANNDTNECFYAYVGTEEAIDNCPDVRQCNKITKNDSCGQAQVFGNDGKPKETAEYCHLEAIPGGFFPTNFYCSDGRTLPSFNGSYNLKISSILAVLLAFVALAI